MEVGHVGVQNGESFVGCGNRRGTKENVSPSVITHQGDKTCELSKGRQNAWLTKIRKEDLKPEKYPHTRVCLDHFVTGKPSKLYETKHPD